MIFILVSLLAEALITSSAKNLDYRYGAMLNAGFFQGDIAGFDPLTFSDRGAIANLKNLWPNGIVYYKIHNSVDFLESEIEDAMNEYEKKTCIRFRKATSANQDYVHIAYLDGCWSRLGRDGGEQHLSLGDGCHDKGTILHELGHALGFIHEQSRSDRDDHLNIIWSNIEEGQEPQFTKMKYYENNLLEETFDYKSIMLYGEYSFAKDGTSPTILAKDPRIVIGPVFDKYFLSKSDVNRVNKLYQCFGMERPKPPQAPDIICDLEEDDCGILNERGSTAFKRRFMSLGGRRSTVYRVDAATEQDHIFGLRTPQFSLYGNKEACFTFDYYLNGKGIYYMYVYKRTIKLLETKEKIDGWKTFSATVTEEDDNVRFYIGGSVIGRTPNDGILAIDNISFKLSPCT